MSIFSASSFKAAGTDLIKNEKITIKTSPSQVTSNTITLPPVNADDSFVLTSTIPVLTNVAKTDQANIFTETNTFQSVDVEGILTLRAPNYKLIKNAAFNVELQTQNVAPMNPRIFIFPKTEEADTSVEVLHTGVTTQRKTGGLAVGSLQLGSSYVVDAVRELPTYPYRNDTLLTEKATMDEMAKRVSKQGDIMNGDLVLTNYSQLRFLDGEKQISGIRTYGYNTGHFYAVANCAVRADFKLDSSNVNPLYLYVNFEGSYESTFVAVDVNTTDKIWIMLENELGKQRTIYFWFSLLVSRASETAKMYNVEGSFILGNNANTPIITKNETNASTIVLVTVINNGGQYLEIHYKANTTVARVVNRLKFMTVSV